MNIVKFETNDNNKTASWKKSFRKNYGLYDLKPGHLLSINRINGEMFMFLGLRTRSKNCFVFQAVGLNNASQFIALTSEDAIKVLNKI